MKPLAHDRYCDEIAHRVNRLRDVVTSGADLSATVPTCPEWSLEQLLRHVGAGVSRADALVRARSRENIPASEVPGAAGPREWGDAPALDKWLGEAGESFVAALREAGPDVPVWTWMGLRTTGVWARRMTHETVVHHADAALAAGLSCEIAPEVAADGLDELLELTLLVLPLRGRDGALREGSARSVHLHATDTGAALDAEWLMEFGAGGLGWRRGHEKAAVALRGPLTALLLASYRRLPPDAPGLEVLGDREVLDFWLQRATFG
ncbi:maleylpyruvate isomerase family mycothiol-dependent enzyme [Streptomyces sp. NPDC090108]|uniref:maleylpyruvate isomerase family mycothiol-dependent enzyme n=1 Tax=Streptomyces sp. NPDC090108 TaxID=3365947 RepID=UPI00382A8B39